MRRTHWRVDELARRGRVRGVLSMLAQSSAATIACAMWVGLAMPGLQLLPGTGPQRNEQIAISLQSALLGIDDRGNRANASVRAALRALGLAPNTPLARLLSQPPPPDGTHGPAVVELDSRAVADTSAPAEGTNADQPTVSAVQPEPDVVRAEPAPTATNAGPVPPRPVTPPSQHHTQPTGATAPSAPGSAPAPPVPPAPPAPPALQAITFDSTPPADAVVDGPAYKLSATATSRLPVDFSADSASAGVCTVSGATVSFVGAGTCVVDANQAGNTHFRAAPQAQQSFTVRPAAKSGGGARTSRSVQSITFTSAAPAYAVLGGTYYVSATASSGLPVSFAVEDESLGVCTSFGPVVSFDAKGTCTIVASQGGDAHYDAAPNVTQSFAVHRRPQTITFTSLPPSSASVGGATYAVAATASSGLSVVFSADPSSAGVCTVSGSTVTPVGPGTCFVDADQFGSSTYQAAPQVQQSFAVGAGSASKSVQSITFTSTPPAGAVVGGSYTVSANASSGLAVAFSADPSSAGVCTVAGSTVSFVGAGTCTVDADQPGDASYQPAPQVQQSFAIGLRQQTISFMSTPPGGAVVGGADYVVSAVATSGLPVTFSADASSAGICTVSGSNVSLVGAGTCTVDADQAGDGTHAAAPQVQQSFAISVRSKSVQTINFTSTAPTSATVGGAAYDVSASASSGLAVAFSIEASSGGVCSLSGSTVTFSGAGTCTIDADQAGDASYQPAAQAQQSFRVDLAPQTISFNSTPPAGAVAGGADYVISAAASSGLTVTFSADATSAGVCTVAGSNVSFVGVGTCTVDADQGGNATYAAAPQVQQSFFVSGVTKSAQTITFTTTAPTAAEVGGSYDVEAVASSGLAVAFSADGASGGVCTVSGSTVSFVGTGTCTVDADQPGDMRYEAAPQAQQSFAVGRRAQTIRFTSTAPASVNVGDPDYVVSAAATSSLSVSFSADASSAGVCTVSGSNVSFVGVGTCTVDADQAGNATYAGAPQVQQSFSVGGPPTKSVQSINFTSSAPAGAVVGGAYTVAASASSGLPVGFSADPSAAGVCTVSGSTVSFAGAGTCTIDADQAGDANYQAAPTAQQSFTVGRQSQAISFTSPPPAAPIVGGPTYTVTASASSGLAVTLAIAPASSAVCAISGSTVSFIGSGTCTIDADQAGDASYQPAAQVQQSFVVSPATPPRSVQSITFTSAAPANAVVGGSYTVTASASSGLTVSFSAGASSAGVCTVSGSTVSFVGNGTCTVDADQAGDANYQPAPQVQQSFAVSRQPQTISFTSTPPAGAVAGGATYSVAASATSGLAVTFSIAPASSGVCTASGSSVSFVGAGTCTIRADQAGDATYAPAPQVEQSFSVSAPPKSVQSITFTSTAPSNAAVGGSYTVSATASSGLAVTFTADATSSGVCTVSGSDVSFVGTGTCTIDADQSGNASYQPAPQVQQSFSVGGVPQTITYTSTPPSDAAVGGPTYTVSATASSGLPVAFTVDASSGGVCTVSGSTVTMVHAGTCTIDANQAGNSTYAPAPQVQQSFTIARGSQTITFTSTPPNPAGANSPPYTVTATATSGLPVVFTTDPWFSSGVCSVSGSTVTFQGHGVCVIYANQGGSSDWLPAPQAVQFFFVQAHV